MAFVSAVTGDDSTKKFMEVLQNDFKTLSLETKKKYPQIREVLINFLIIDLITIAMLSVFKYLNPVVNVIVFVYVKNMEPCPCFPKIFFPPILIIRLKGSNYFCIIC